jgi:hypothetical protein
MRLFIPILLLFSTGALAEYEFGAELIHSDVPLWSAYDEEVWPRKFTDDDGSFGCAWQVKLGDWKITLHDGEEDWIRFSNYGVFHCYTMVSETADDRAELNQAPSKQSYFIDLGNHKINGQQVELWAIQRGARPGSDYTLLSREANTRPTAVFNLLQATCPEGKMRKGPSLDILLTGYCSINTKQELTSLALSMAKIRPLGKLTFEAESPDN